MIIENYPKNTYLYKKGDLSDFVYIVIKGEVKEILSQDKFLVKSIGNFVGYMNLVNKKVCLSSAITVKEC